MVFTRNVMPLSTSGQRQPAMAVSTQPRHSMRVMLNNAGRKAAQNIKPRMQPNRINAFRLSSGRMMV